MIKLFFTLILLSSIHLCAQPTSSVIQLHPENPHYFQYKGEPLVLVTSAEHYGAVLNLDFDYEMYLQTLHNQGMNYTRIFTGAYVEIPGAFGIGNNTLAPATGRFIAPWQRVDEDGLYEGEQKFDLDQWAPEYFERLKRFITMAEEWGIIVEVTFFSSIYTDTNWERNPFHPQNNVNGISNNLDRRKVNTLDNGMVQSYQKKMVAKIVEELNEYGNVIYEIQNEPWSDDPQKVMRTLRTLDPRPGEGDWFKWADNASQASLEWQKAMAQVIVDTEQGHPNTHLIAQNFNNFKHSLEQVDPNISVLNFHYAWPEAVWLNYAWNRPISFDESGFAGSSDTTYLRQAWQFLLAGGAVFNNLDYSFYVGKEDGTGNNEAPGGGSTTLREQLSYLRAFIESFDFVKMKPDFEIVYHAPGVQYQAISEPGRQYAMVFTGIATEWVKLSLPKGSFRYEFFLPFTGEMITEGNIEGNNKEITKLNLPEFDHMVALKIVR